MTTDTTPGLQRIVTDPRSLSAQVLARIRELIASGTLAPGQRLPTEHEFSDSFGVGRTTVREALRQLENDGLIQVRRGQGRFVSAAPAMQRPLTRLESVTEMMQASGYQVTNRVLSVAVQPPTDEERATLRLGENAEVIRLERLRLCGDEVYIYSVDVLPSAYFAHDIGAIDWRGSLLKLLEQRNVRPAFATARISALQLPKELSHRLGVKVSLPWLLMVQVNTTDDGLPVIYSHDYHRGDRFSFDVPRRAE